MSKSVRFETFLLLGLFVVACAIGGCRTGESSSDIEQSNVNQSAKTASESAVYVSSQRLEVLVSYMFRAYPSVEAEGVCLAICKGNNLKVSEIKEYQQIFGNETKLLAIRMLHGKPGDDVYSYLEEILDGGAESLTRNIFRVLISHSIQEAKQKSLIEKILREGSLTTAEPVLSYGGNYNEWLSYFQSLKTKNLGEKANGFLEKQIQIFERDFAENSGNGNY